MTNGNDLVYPTNDCREGTLTKRELFAAMAMQGILSNGSCVDENAYTNIITKDAVRMADALIEQLNKEVQS